MALLSDSVDAVIGVDTHRDSHSACLVNPVGGELAAITVTADADGYAHLVRWATAHAPGPTVVWAIEGPQPRLRPARVLRSTSRQVIESDRPKRVSRRGSGKNDALDARRAAREALGREQNAILAPMARGRRSACCWSSVTGRPSPFHNTRPLAQVKLVHHPRGRRGIAPGNDNLWTQPCGSRSCRGQ
ncbi:transposase [Nonomuraea sp. NN258]|uniref:IS110 family transposase n=1 Tax=Nonomuraea antri TaxID=2730852 RepID=UPI00156A13F5|nr:transposase [Nonomuraea antri]NRQ32125.1 transposase [Nonomuraea antri]